MDLSSVAYHHRVMLLRLSTALLCACSGMCAAICVTLPARIELRNGRLREADETRLDTARMQRALDSCGPGNTVRLALEGRNSAFVSGPIQLRASVTLTIDKGVTLFASRDARQFQTRQGSCGVVDDNGHGCKPLLSCSHLAGATLTGASLSGEGTIDGQADSTILGETYSWRDLAQEARLKNGKLNAPSLLDRQTCRALHVFQVNLRNDSNALF